MISFLASCSINKYIPEDKYLLTKVKLNNEPKELSYDLKNLVKQSPNKKSFGLYEFNTLFYLWITNQNKVSKFDTFLFKNFGERPVYLDTNLIHQSASQQEDFLLNKGYFNAEVDLKIDRWKKRARVDFYYSELSPHYIDKVLLGADNPDIYKLVTQPQYIKFSHLKTGEIFDSENLLKERTRLARILNENGYYQFSKYFIYFDVDTTFSEQHKADVKAYIRKFNDTANHKVFKVDEIIIDPYFSIYDTTKKKQKENGDLIFLYSEKKKTNEKLFIRNVRIKKGELFNISHVNQTVNQLSDIQLYKYIDVNFKQIDSIVDDTAHLIAEIKLTPYPKYERGFDLELNTTEETREITATSNRYYGMAGNIFFRDRNFFKSAVQWYIKLGGAFDVQSQNIQNEQFFGNYQFNLKNSLYFPTAFLPSRMLSDNPQFLSKTALNASYVIENNQDFRRRIATAGITYQFTSQQLENDLRFFVTPIEFNLLETDLQEFFQTKLQEYNDPLLNSVFETHVLTPIKTSLVFNGRTKARNRIMAKFGFESAGILPWTYNNIFNNNSSDLGANQDNYKISGIPFFQYIRTDFEFSFQQMFFGQKNSINARLDLGLGIPYGNSQLMPFEKLYYVGGANSMRAWPLRGLGPGSYYDSSDIRFNQSGNLKFETNFEYRFNMVSILKGAFFVDIGNVWTNSEDENRPGSEFYLENFFKELAVGTGFGIRWDFTFFILRTDFAVPVREPSMPESNRWVLKQNKLDDVNVTIGIGYPF